MARFKAYALLSLISKIIRPRVGATKAPRIDATVRGPPLEHQKSSQIVQLPDEILFIISDHSSLTDRARLLQTCRYFHSLLEVTQYRYITASSWMYYRSDRLHRTLSERPDLIRCIVSYHGPLVPTYQPQPTKKRNGITLRLRKSATSPSLWYGTPVTETEWFQRAIYIFTNAVNLQELVFTHYVDWMSNPIWKPVRTLVSKMPLTYLDLPTTPESAEAVSLLRALPGLEHLQLSWAPARLENLKEGDIPKLKWLRATLQDAATIIPGRPVGEFHHVLGAGEAALDEQLVRKLSLSSSPITKLRTCLYNPWDHDLVRSALQVFARHLPEIRHLEITVGGAIPGQILLDEIPSFQSLRFVKFVSADLLPARDQDRSIPRESIDSDSDTGGAVAPQNSMVEDWDVLVQMLQERCPSLVDIEHTPKPICYSTCCFGPRYTGVAPEY